MDAIRNNPKLTALVLVVIIAVVVLIVVLTRSESEYLFDDITGTVTPIKTGTKMGTVSHIKTGTKMGTVSHIKTGTKMGTVSLDDRSKNVAKQFKEASIAVTEVKNPSECLKLARHYDVNGVLYSDTKRGNLCVIYSDKLFQPLDNKSARKISKY